MGGGGRCGWGCAGVGRSGREWELELSTYMCVLTRTYLNVLLSTVNGRAPELRIPLLTTTGLADGAVPTRVPAVARV